jgi:hypothetical protein
LLQRGGVQTARAKEALYGGPELPPPLAYLWGWFMELDSQRQVGMAGLGPIAYTDVKAWAELTGRHPKPHEVSALMRLDAVVRIALQAKPEKD